MVAVFEVTPPEVNAVGNAVQDKMVVKVDAPAHNDVVARSHLERTQK